MGNKILTYKLFEAIYIGKIDLKSYKSVFDPNTGSAWFNVTDINDDKFEMEIKSNGIHDDKKIHSVRIFSPTNFEFNFEDLTNKIIYISNKNRLGFKFKIDEIVYPKYGLLPYSVISISPKLDSLVQFEKIISSTKPVNNMVKSDGGLDQFTF